jgi:signal transduction histidine kinase
LNAFIADLQAASGDPNGGRLPDLASASLEPLIEGVLKFLRPLLQERQLEVELDLSPDALGARFDAPRIEQVLTNLLSNAIRHAEPRSSVGVRTLLLAAAGHRFVEVSVSDSGPGISPQDRERIFEPYVRTGDDRTGSGLGLGLAICKRIVQSHGGTIGVFDVPERPGSRFAFTLLAADLPEAC